MKEVKIHDKIFVEHLSREVVQARVAGLGPEIAANYGGQPPLVLSVLNGAFIFTADLMRTLGMDAEVAFIRVSSYGGGMTSSGKVRQLLGLDIPVAGRKVLIVEDIVDTGHTVHWLRQELSAQGAAEVKVAALLFKKEAFQHDQEPEFTGFVIPNEFVVGYGLDYNQLGRGLDAIYKLKG